MQNKWSVALYTVAIIWIIAILLAWGLEGFSALPGQEAGNVAVIPVQGPIVSESADGFFASEEASARDTIEFIRHADSDPSIKAIILDINSPGGSPVPTDEISRAVKRTNKTTVALIHDVGASGAYWIATASDHIIVNPMSIVGSIGVYSSWLDFAGLMDKYGVTYNRMVAGQYKDLGSPFRNLTEDERAILQAKMDLLHERFIKEVAGNRNLSYETVKKLADGQFFLGEEAINLGLVDQLGSEEDAVEYLEQRLNASVSLVEYSPEKGFWSMLSSLMEKQSYRIGQGIGRSLVTEKTVPIRT